MGKKKPSWTSPTRINFSLINTIILLLVPCFLLNGVFGSIYYYINKINKYYPYFLAGLVVVLYVLDSLGYISMDIESIFYKINDAEYIVKNCILPVLDYIGLNEKRRNKFALQSLSYLMKLSYRLLNKKHYRYLVNLINRFYCVDESLAEFPEVIDAFSENGQRNVSPDNDDELEITISSVINKIKYKIKETDDAELKRIYKKNIKILHSKYSGENIYEYYDFVKMDFLTRDEEVYVCSLLSL